MHTCTKALLVLALASLVSATVVGIDFGTEYFKVRSTQASLIKPGKKLTIVENTQSKRMTPNMVAFTPQERLFGADAQVLRVKIPQASIAYSLRLLGQTFNDTAVRDRIALEDWPYSLVENTERGTFNYSVNADVYSVESIVGMVLEDLKTMAEVQAEGSVKDCVITIPAFFTRAQRMELVQVAEAAGLNVISLIHENTAAALYHGIDRMDNETSYFAIIYNLGASYLQTSLVKYSTADVRLGRGSSRTIENIEVLAHSWDKDLGGSTFDALITEYLAQTFLDKHGVDPHLNQRAMAKLTKKANEVKKTLSAGKATQVYIEALMDGKDLVTPFDRETFEALLEPLVPRLVKPVQDVLEQSGVSIEEIGDIELIGGVTRVPKVQETLRKAFGRDLSNHLNGDESMAHGAALFAANYTSEVQLRPMYLTDIVNYDIEGDFYDEKDLDKKSVLFKKGSRLGTKKKITLSHNQDFKCKIKNVYEHEAVPVDLYSLGGVAAFSDKHQKVPVNHMTFVLTFDGFAYLYEAEARLEVEEVVREKVNRTKEVPSDETKPAEENLEPNDETKPAEEVLEPNHETKPTEEVLDQTEGGEGEHTEDYGEDKTTETEQILEDQSSEDEQTNISEPSEEASETEQPTEDAAATEEDKYVERSVTKTLKDRIKVDKEELELPPTLTHEQIRSLQRLLRKLTSDDKERKRLAEAKNEVEGYLYYLRDKLSEEDFVTVTTEEERTQLGDFLTDTETWLEDTESPEASTYSARTSELKAKSQAALSRLEERENRSHVVEQAYKQIEAIRTQLDEFNKTKSWVSAEVKDEVYKKANETQAWLEENVILQDLLKPSEAPILTQVKVEAKIHALERSFDIAKRTPKPKAEKKSKLPSDFIKFGGGMDGSNIKMDNVTIDGEEYSPEDTKLEL